MHEPAEAAALRFRLLKEGLTHPPLCARGEIVQRDDRWAALALAVHEQRPRLGEHATRDHLRQVQAPRVEEDGAGDRIEDDQESGACRLHQQRPFHHPHAVGRESTELGLLPDDLAALDVDGRERTVGRHKERARWGDLLPADVAAESRRPYRSRSCGRSRGRGRGRGFLRGRCLHDKSGNEQDDGQQRHGDPLREAHIPP